MASTQKNATKSIAQKNNPNRNIKEPKGKFSLEQMLAIILALLSIIVYANTFNHDFAYDDMSVINKNTIVTRGISAIPEILSTPYRYGFFKTTNDLYRPLSQVLFATEYELSGGSASIMHVINVLFFAGCVILLFIFLDELFEKKKTVVAFIASILFALHPIHTEVVANIKSRDELMCFFFAFSSLIVFIKYSRTGKAMLLVYGFVLFFLSLLSKESVITFLALIPMIFFFYQNRNRLRSLYITLCSILAAAIFLFIRFSVLSTYHANSTFDIKFIDNALVNAPSVASKLATATLVMGSYIKLLIFPYPLISDYAYSAIPFVNFANILVLLSASIYILIISVGVYRMVKFSRDPFAFGVLFFLITIALFSNIFFLIGAEMAERFVFFASAGYCLIIALFIEKWTIKISAADFLTVLKQKNVTRVIVPISLTFAILTIVRNNDWANSLTLYKADVKQSPNDARLYLYLGNELLITKAAEERDPVVRRQIAEEAISYLKQSLAIYPDYSEAHTTLGNGYFFVSQLDSAAEHYKKAVALKPNDMEAWNNLDVTYFNAQKYRESIEVCKKIIEIDPQCLDKYNNIGICYIRLAQYDSAAVFLKKGALLNPALNSFYENLALAFKLNNNTDSAKKYEVIARKNNPGFSVY